MPRGNPLSDETKRSIYTKYTLGERVEDIAEDMGLHPASVRRIIREERKSFEKEREAMARSGKIVKKDGNGGKLMALSPDGFEFSHVTPDGKSHKKKVDGHISRVAEQQYDKWCNELDDECEFMRKVERKPKDRPAAPTDEPDGSVVCGYPSDPIEEIRPVKEVDITPAPVPEIAVRPWREVAEEREQEIERLNKQIAELEKRLEGAKSLDGVIADTELEQPKLGHWFNGNGSFRVVWLKKPAYAIWAKSDTPKFFGLYGSMERALKKLDELNEVAAFLGNDGAFEVEEVAWKG